MNDLTHRRGIADVLSERTEIPADLLDAGAPSPERPEIKRNPSWLRIGVVIPTSGRAETLKQVIGLLDAQTRQPEQVVVSAVTPDDVLGLKPRDGLKVVFGPKGSCKQRNTALGHLDPSIDVIVFFDDDFVAHPRWIEAVTKCFEDRPQVDGVTGYLLADGVRTGGIDLRDSLNLINRYQGEFEHFVQERYSPYGCNMAFRKSAMNGLTFDERLVLYGWLEDRDFGAGIAKRGGKQIKMGKAIGVHMGVNRGRSPGRKLGYSQVVNPIYLFFKRHMTARQVASHLMRNIGMNVVRSLSSEPHIDRVGRLVGNLTACRDLLRGVLEPERAASL